MYGVNKNLVAARQLRGWTEEEAVLPIDKKAIEYDGTIMTLFEWCEFLQLHHEDTYLRIIRGHKLEDIAKEECLPLSAFSTTPIKGKP
jgi:hypothetical protein